MKKENGFIASWVRLGMTAVVALTLFHAPLAVAQDAQTDSREEPTDIELALVEIPMPDLEVLSPGQRELLEPAIDYFEMNVGEREGQALGRLYGRLGMHFQAHGMLEPAHAAFRNAVLLDPQNYRWSYLLALNFEQAGEDNRAIAMYALSVGLNPANMAARTRLGLVLIRDGHLDEAEKHLQQVLKNSNRDAVALSGLGQISFLREQYERSISYFMRALESQPQAGQIHQQIAAAYTKLGDEENAALQMEKFTPRIPVIDDPLVALLEAHRISASQFADTGAGLMKEGRYAEAVKMFEFSTAINPEYQPSFIALAQGHRYLDNDELAYAAIDEAIATDPNDAFASYIKASWLDQDGRPEAAVPYYHAAIESMPEFQQARMLLANALMNLGEYQQAKQQYNEILAQNQQQITAMYLSGIASLALGDCAEAMTLVDQALGTNPENVRVLTVQARIYATCPSASEAQRSIALENARTLYDVQPIADTAVTLAMALAAAGEYDEAVDFQAQAMFEAIRDQQEQRRVALAENMDRYRQQQPAAGAWSDADPLYQAPRNIRQDPAPVTASTTAEPQTNTD